MNIRYLQIPYSILTLLNWKILYYQKFKVDSFINVFIGSNCELLMAGNNPLFQINGRLVLRRDVCININGGSLILGPKVFFNRGCSINCQESIEIGNSCIFGENVMIYDHDHNFREEGSFQSQGFSREKIVIEDNVWVGSSSIILKGSYIGKNSVIAAGSVVRGTIPSDTLFYNKRENVFKTISIRKNEDVPRDV
jgi:acetyltransferase-like isoleucine patch superfamily enzyme